MWPLSAQCEEEDAKSCVDVEVVSPERSFKGKANLLATLTFQS